jgi:hypothetical protein
VQTQLLHVEVDHGIEIANDERDVTETHDSPHSPSAYAEDIAPPPNGSGAQLRPTAPPRPSEHQLLMPEGYQTFNWNALLGVSCNRVILIEPPSCDYATRRSLDA